MEKPKRMIPVFKYQVDENIYLSLLEIRHAATLYNVIANNREHIGKFLSFAINQTLEDTRAFIESSLNKFAAGAVIPCGVWYRNQLVGAIDLRMSPGNKSASIGYWIANDYQGRGIMTKCCQSLIDYAFKELLLNRIEIRAITTNITSRSIPERLGFTQEGVIRQDVSHNDGFADSAVYGLLAEEWQL